MNIFVRASKKSHIPLSHVPKSGCRLENCLAYICAVYHVKNLGLVVHTSRVVLSVTKQYNLVPA